MKSVKQNGKPRNAKAPKTKSPRAKATARPSKRAPEEQTANEVMLEAWKEIFRTRHRRLL